jgi:hypothetical protein
VPKFDLLGDDLWRTANLYTIVDKQANRVSLRPNSVQRAINASTANRKAILKSRQMGVSTNELIKQFDYVCWTPNVNACILAHEKDAIEKLFRIPKRAWEFMDPEIRPDVDRGGGSKYEMYFPAHNSRIYCDLESRGDTIHWLHISEAAFADPDRLKSTMQAVPLHGKVTIETTPNGMGNHFYDFWMDQKQPYAKLFYPWFIFDEYRMDTPPMERTQEELLFTVKAKRAFGVDITDAQIAFRRLKQAELGLLFIQEYPEDDQSCFLASGHSAMDLRIVKALLDAAPKPIEERDGLKVFEYQYADGVYVIGADVAEGVGSDFSVAKVIEAKTLREVAVLRGQWAPARFAERIVELANLYAARGVQPLVAVERNNHGHAVTLWLNEHLQYPHLFRDKDERLGWKTDMVSRPLMIDTFIEAVENRRLGVLDSDTLRECLTLVDNEGKIEADGDKHDDCVIASAIALQMALNQSKLSALYENIGSKIFV